ncbi:OprO/OprP family phosphate-selective porin [Pseudomonas sp. Marseille-QA0892]
MSFRHFAGFAATALALAVSAQVSAGTVTTDGADIIVKTKGGLEVGTADKAFGFKVGGRLQADYSRFDGIYTNNGNTADAAYFRRAFLELSGYAFTDWRYNINYDFSHNAGSSDDGYFDEASISYTGIKPLTFKFGRFDPEFGLEKATSSKWVTAPERNAAYELVDWANSHQNGLGFAVQANPTDSVYASLGLHSKDANDTDGDSQKQVNLRAVFAPMHEAGNVLHLGANFARRDVSDSAIDTRFRSRLGMRGVATGGGNDAGTNGNRVVFGGANNQPAGSFDDDTAWGLEAAWAMGPLSVQGEYLRRKLKADDSPFQDIKSSGYYGQVAYTITGEPRAYRTGRFDSIKPSNKQFGAWEVFYRYDYLKVEDDNGAFANVGDTKGKVHNLGVNWYANENVKVTAAYIKAKVDNLTNANGDDDGDGFVLRGQYQF